jgi:two-component system sensor histidine kinase KdpD
MMRRSSRGVIPYIASLGLVLAATGICALLAPIVAPSSLSLVYLTAVLFCALRNGLWPSILCSALSELSWNFFFVPPKFSFAVADSQDILALILFLTISLVVSNLVARVKKQDEAIDNARLQTETERLRNAMLTSISHDLRTPLTTIIGAHSMLKSLGEECDPETRAELIDRAQFEAERLNRLIGNLLDMTRLESGKLNLKLGPVDIADALGCALGRADDILLHHKVSIDLPDNLPMIDADFLLLEQVIFNVIDNAAKYAPPDTQIHISASVRGDRAVLEIGDEGDGIPPDALEAIFDKFARFRLEDRRQAGTGLGLAICRGFLEAMGGSITAYNRDNGAGAIFAIRLPVAKISEGSQMPI